MNYQGRTGRQESSRLSGQSGRQEWIPRGTTTTSISNPPSRVSSVSSPTGNGDHSTYTSAPRDFRQRSHFTSRNQVGRPSQRRKERERERERERSEDQKVKVVEGSNLPQLVQEIQEKLIKGTVECMICYDMVWRSASIWSCSSCYSIFHLNCIKKWARAPTSVDSCAETNQGFNWRCPGCQSVQLTAAEDIRYMCFCGNRPAPPSDLYLTPHSCGEPCGKPLEREFPGGGTSKDDRCPHVCVLQCHPGPCPPCKAFAPPRSCPCGKKIITTRCSDRKSVLTCGQCCGRLLDCWRHRCDRVCHVGKCDPCQVLIHASCFCNRKVETLLCGDMAVKGGFTAGEGVFSCSSTCGKILSCGNHACLENCHPGPCGECELMPSRTRTCCCGKTDLHEERKSCLDPIPTCEKTCGKPLFCSVHNCKEGCHAGDCPPCLVLVNQKCRCGSTSRTVECYKTTSENAKFTCEKHCGRKKNCGRHRCSERCCPLSRLNSLPTGEWDPHFCSMPCEKKLRCGQHSCQSLCHIGHCPPCIETIFSDLTCACGRTSIPPPLPCGTPTPSCQYPCSVPQPCGHPSSHNCHFGDCPPCSFPIAKECIGGHVVLRNIPCGSKEIRCNKLCGKTRQCGLHACARTCHPPPCDLLAGTSSGSKASCAQTCGAPRRDCRHTCTAPCHPSSPCPDTRCNFPVTITCSCGRISTTVPCDAGGCNGGFSGDTIYEASIIQKLPAPLQHVEAGKKVPLGQRKLVCDDDCAKLERRRVLAAAFDITPPNLDSLHFNENLVVSESFSDFFRRDPKWVMSVEERCKFLVLGKSKESSSGLRVHVFCPMVKEKRDAVRLIAEKWKLSVNAAGWEPKRFVVVHAPPKLKSPARILGSKGSVSTNPVLDPYIDMDPRLVVSLLDLPRDADISALVLRFGGECELIWLNDKNALAVFTDPARAATAMRRLDHGSVYHGVVIASPTHESSTASSGGASAWGGVRGNPWKKPVVQESDSWESKDWAGGSSSVQTVNWRGKEAPISAAVNRWNVLDPEASSGSVIGSDKASGEGTAMHSVAEMEPYASGPSSGQQGGAADVVDDWEKAYD